MWSDGRSRSSMPRRRSLAHLGREAPGPRSGISGRCLTGCVDLPGAIVQPIPGRPPGAVWERSSSPTTIGLGPDRPEAISSAATKSRPSARSRPAPLARPDRRFQAVSVSEGTHHRPRRRTRTVLMDRAAAFAWDLATPRGVLLAEVEAIAGRQFSALAGTPAEGALRHPPGRGRARQPRTYARSSGSGVTRSVPWCPPVSRPDRGGHDGRGRPGPLRATRYRAAAGRGEPAPDRELW